MDKRIKQLTAEFKKSPESAKAAVRRSLRMLLDEQFALHQEMRERELAAVEERVQKLRSSLDDRESAKDDLIERRLDTLLGVSGGSTDEGDDEPAAKPVKKPPQVAAAPRSPP